MQCASPKHIERQAFYYSSNFIKFRENADEEKWQEMLDVTEAQKLKCIKDIIYNTLGVSKNTIGVIKQIKQFSNMIFMKISKLFQNLFIDVSKTW